MSMELTPTSLSRDSPFYKQGISPVMDITVDDMDEWPVLGTDTDGTVDKLLGRRIRAPVAAVFIHAGAGYHSTSNEGVHLKACSQAARAAMRLLKQGGSATVAVEAAVRSLENEEITNAGFGSNLNMDGVVECDATIVDHFGRSGACGAVPGIKNPICLAKLILDKSSQPLSLRRVPPNMLVGAGAQKFAEEHGVEMVSNASLISRNAQDRYLRWAEDLRQAEMQGGKQPMPLGPEYVSGIRAGDYERAARHAASTELREHQSAILTGTWNEGQPDSPYQPGTPYREATPPLDIPHRAGQTSASSSRGPRGMAKAATAPIYTNLSERTTLSFMGALQTRGIPCSRHQRRGTASNAPGQEAPSSHDRFMSSSPATTYADVGIKDDKINGIFDDSSTHKDGQADMEDAGEASDSDLITDTVGAIAVDMQGRIAAASSSGGIGMKHGGRTGPAALVGIGTFVLPADDDDEDGTAVATVTSGTGEHMATTMASAKCAERLYHGTRRGAGGANQAEDDEQRVLESFVVEDFMRHPGVRSQHSTGALGVMAVKKTRAAMYFYFAHNTDSFALASFASNEREPLMVMSRLGQGQAGQVAQGARRILMS